MKLHTDFHDYYDYAVGYGIDENVHYNRFTKEVEIGIKPMGDFPPTGLDAYLLGFCGTVYPITELKKINRSIYDCEYDYGDYEVIETYWAYSFEEAEGKYREWEDTCKGFYYSNDRERLRIKQFFIDWKFQSDEIFLEHKVPVWIIRMDTTGNKGLVNPKLKDYEFDRIKDSFTTFQEISVYLSNILVEQKETAIIEDKFRIEQHGFDLKKSFRKERKA
ncbi:MAG TPA: hypothetical protein VK892_07620 [Pyrinomonadaceae bacterium]|nr:hypothetical protein [Pyrinomonadaceae bacterium]